MRLRTIVSVLHIFFPFVFDVVAFGRFSPSVGAFLVPYMAMVFVIGIPIFFAELFVGQYSGLGPIKAYQRLAPLFHGKHENELDYDKDVWLRMLTISISTHLYTSARERAQRKKRVAIEWKEGAGGRQHPPTLT